MLFGVNAYFLQSGLFTRCGQELLSKVMLKFSDFRIHTPLVISAFVDKVKIQLYKAGPSFELWDDTGQVRFVSTRGLQQTPSLPPRPSLPREDNLDIAIEGKYFYPHIRRFGYEYGTSFQLIDRLTKDTAYLKREPCDWISYLDSRIHLKLFHETSFAYPISSDRVFFWENSLSEAPSWAVRPQDGTIGNSTVLIEGIHVEYVPVTKNGTFRSP